MMTFTTGSLTNVVRRSGIGATLACVLVVLAGGVAAQADQGGGSIRGSIHDALGAAIVGANVEIVCGGTRTQVTTSRTGEFAATGLPDGRCRVTGSSELFESESTMVDSRSGAPARLVLAVRRFESEVVVTPARGDVETTFGVPEATSVTSPRDLERRPYALLMQALREEPGVLVQQTTSAQTSPIIRGFTGQSNVYLLDGVRLNTSAWRTGPSQYTSWVDPGAVGSIEILRGTGSVQYGSDALGGTVQLNSSPAIMSGVGPLHGSVEFAGATADESVGGRADIGFHVSGAAVRVGGSRQTVNDLRTGGGIDSHAAVTRFFGLPSTIVADRNLATGFEQRGLYALADLTPFDKTTVHAFFMHDNQSGASRYDRLMGGEGLYRSGFDPQTLNFGLVRYSRSEAALFNGGVSATFSVNRQLDGRFEQTRPTTRLDRQSATTSAVGYQGQGRRNLGARHELLVGAELYNESTGASREFLEPTGVITPARPDIPDGTRYTNLGFYVQDTAAVHDRITLRGGARFGRFSFSTEADPAFGVIDETITTSSFSFQAATVARLTEKVVVTGNITRGFRAANAADFGSIGLTGGGGFEITPAAANGLGGLVGTTGAADAVSTGKDAGTLRPEVVYQYDLGLKTRVGRFAGTINAFDMELYDFIQRRALVFPSSIVGTTISGFEIVRQDPSGVAYIAQDARPVATRVNVDRGRIRGLDVEGEIRLGTAWTGGGHFSMTNGRALPSGEFLRRIPPPMGAARLRWMSRRIWLEGVVHFAREQSRLNSGDLGDSRIGANRTRASIATFFTQGATDSGLVVNGILQETGETLAQVQNRVLGTANSAPLYTSEPGYATVGIRGGISVTAALDIDVFAENLGDVNYRYYGSGLDAAGFNVQIRTRYRF
jgi:outer membrane receptor protein involved in Fe transport